MTLIRPYHPSDRQAIRELAINTAEMGNRSTFLDLQLQADLLTRYYTDHEPSSLWILEKDGHIAGYLSGCLDTRKFISWLRLQGHALTIMRMFLHNLFRPTMWRWIQARFRTLRAGGAHRPAWMVDYPAHLHINLSSDVRGLGVGSQLLEKFAEQCRLANVRGIHLSTLARNTRAQNFFKKNGFLPLTSIEAYRWNGQASEGVPVVVMGRKLP